MVPPSPLSLFLTLARRPHNQCLHHLRSTPTRTLRFASSLPSSPRTPPPSAQQSQTPNPSPTSKIPLHLGLDRNPTQLSAISKIPIPKGRRGEVFTPSVLSRPLGLPDPPKPGENSPYDKRSWSQRWQDFSNPNKALGRRRVYLRSYLRPYFQEWKRMDFNKGKSFRSNERMFKREKALYFPNVVGDTLSKAVSGKPVGESDSVGVMMGKVSVVAMMSGRWAEEQVDSFLSSSSNPKLQELLRNMKGLRRVDVNMQGDWMRMLLVKLFKRRLRKTVPEERWGHYFMVKLPRDIRQGLTEEVRDAMGLLNSQVGYVYLVDSECRIRWAGSGYAWEGEIEGLNNAVERLMNEELLLRGRHSAGFSEAGIRAEKTHAEKQRPGIAHVEKETVKDPPTPEVANA